MRHREQPSDIPINTSIQKNQTIQNKNHKRKQWSANGAEPSQRSDRNRLMKPSRRRREATRSVSAAAGLGERTKLDK